MAAAAAEPPHADGGAVLEAARRALDGKAKPPGSLGDLEAMAIK